MTVEKTQENLSTALERTEQALGGLENSLGKNVEASLLATAENSEANDGLPEGWANSQIADIAEVNPKKIDADPDVISGFVPMSHAPTSFQGRLKYDEKPWGDIQKSYTNFKDKDVIFAKVTPCFENGKAVIVRGLPSGIGAGSSEFYVLRAHENCISEKLIFALIKTYQFAQEGAANMTGAVGLRRVPRAFVEKFPVALPPLAEQTVIAQTLDTLLAQVDNIKTRLDAIPKILKTFRQSVLAAAVSGKLTEEWRGENKCESSDNYSMTVNALRVERHSELQALANRKSKYKDALEPIDNVIVNKPINWKVFSLDEVTFRITYGLTVRPAYVDEGVPIISAKEIKTGLVDYAGAKKFDTAAFGSQREKCKIFLNDVLFSKTGSIGHVARVTEERPICSSQNIAVLSPLVNSKYLEIVMRSPYIQDLASRSVKANAIPDLQLGIMARFPIPCPFELEQTQIVCRVEELFAFADQVEHQVKNAQMRVNNLTQSILAKAFRGELTADWRAENPDLISGDNSAEALLAKIKEERDKLVIKKKTRTTKKKVAN